MKTSRIVGLLALLQLIWMVLVIHKVIDGPTSFAFDVLHEDLIFIIHLMTYFIVRAIEENKKQVTINIRSKIPLELESVE